MLIALMLAVSSWSFSRGFIGYINNTAKARLEPLTTELVALYETTGSWQWTRKKNRRLWHDLLNEHAEDTKRPRSRRNAAENSDQPAQSSAPLKQQGHNSDHRPPPPQLASLLVLADADKIEYLAESEREIALNGYPWNRIIRRWAIWVLKERDN